MNIPAPANDNVPSPTIVMPLIQNEVKCLKCGDVVFSAHRHDFKYCSCGNIGVDGGLEYIRRIGHGLSDGSYVERSMHMPTDAVEAMKVAVKWGVDNGRNEIGIGLAVIRALRDHQLLDMKKFT